MANPLSFYFILFIIITRLVGGLRLFLSLINDLFLFIYYFLWALWLMILVQIEFNWVKCCQDLSNSTIHIFFFPLCFGQITVQFLSWSKVFLIIANIAILKNVIIRLQYFYNNILQTQFFFNNVMCKNNLLLKFYC